MKFKFNKIKKEFESVEEHEENPIRAYYNTECNFSIHCFWDNGFQVCFGDRINGYKKPYLAADTWEEVEEIFRNKLKEGE